MTTSTIDKTGPVFDPQQVTVVFVLGGPGAGKGTQCELLKKDFDFCHLSAGDLLRAEQNRPGSTYGELIRTYIREGNIVPMEVTIKLLENAMRAEMEKNRPGEGWQNGRGRFLIDGFPRKMDQALEFDKTVCPSTLVLFFHTSEDVMLKRLLVRGKTSGREDDNIESIQKRFKVYEADTMPVINHYANLQKIAKVDASGSVKDVNALASEAVRNALA